MKHLNKNKDRCDIWKLLWKRALLSSTEVGISVTPPERAINIFLLPSSCYLKEISLPQAITFPSLSNLWPISNQQLSVLMCQKLKSCLRGDHGKSMAAQAPEVSGDFLVENSQVKFICCCEHLISGSDPGLSHFLLFHLLLQLKTFI